MSRKRKHRSPAVPTRVNLQVVRCIGYCITNNLGYPDYMCEAIGISRWVLYNHIKILKWFGVHIFYHSQSNQYIALDWGMFDIDYLRREDDMTRNIYAPRLWYTPSWNRRELIQRRAKRLERYAKAGLIQSPESARPDIEPARPAKLTGKNKSSKN